MANIISDNEQRVYPLKRPDGWMPKLPRWTLKLPDAVQELVITYVGVQRHNEDVDDHQAIDSVREWVKTCIQPPVVVDTFTVISGRDQPGTIVWACYWIDKQHASTSQQSLDLRRISECLSVENRKSIGLWRETFAPDLQRFETNYSGKDYRPGLAQVQDTKFVEHTLTGYWGAARDRMYASAHDKFDPEDEVQSDNNNDNKNTNIVTSATEEKEPKDNASIGYLTGTNTKTIAHIRSGQFWQRCTPTERHAYETDLEPHLINGLTDIYQRPQDLGDYGLRFLRSSPDRSNNNHLDTKSENQKETCASGFFRSLQDLESWAKSCPSHHKIYNGSVAHRRRFGAQAQMRTWHEICVLKPTEATWEYVNCVPGTGTMDFQPCSILHHTVP